MEYLLPVVLRWDGDEDDCVCVCAAVTLLDTTLKESLEWVTYTRQHDDPQKRGVSTSPILSLFHFILALRRLVCLSWLVNIDARYYAPGFWRPVTLMWPSSLTFWPKNWHTLYSCPAERSHQFCFFFYVFLFSSHEPIRDRRTDGRTGETRNAACSYGQTIKVLLMVSLLPCQSV